MLDGDGEPREDGVEGSVHLIQVEVPDTVPLLKEREELVKIVVSYHPNTFEDRSFDDLFELSPVYPWPLVRSVVEFLFRSLRQASHRGGSMLSER